MLFGNFFIVKTIDNSEKCCTFAHEITTRDGAVVARWAHNPKVVSSSLAPATKPRGCNSIATSFLISTLIPHCLDTTTALTAHCLDTTQKKFPNAIKVKGNVCN